MSEITTDESMATKTPSPSVNDIRAILVATLSIENTDDEYAELHGIDEAATQIAAMFERRIK